MHVKPKYMQWLWSAKNINISFPISNKPILLRSLDIMPSRLYSLLHLKFYLLDLAMLSKYHSFTSLTQFNSF